MNTLYVLTRPATSSAVPIHLEGPRVGYALRPGDVFLEPPIGLADHCKRLSVEEVVRARDDGDHAHVADLIRTAEGQLARPSLAKPYAASRLLLDIISAATEAADSKPAHTKPDSKPADSKPADSKPADSKPADSKPADADRRGRRTK